MKSLFVGNLNFQTTEGDLRGLFEPFGQVVRIYVPMDRETGRPRGFAFVEMANEEEAARAIAELSGREVAGRTLRVTEALPKGERSPRRGEVAQQSRDRVSGMDYGKEAWQPREPRW